jgi:hypothetical protein
MNIVHAGQMEWGENLAAQRSGGMAHKRLFEGEENSADNYLLVLANEGSDYYSPRHRHAWDQVRFCLEGAIPIGRDTKIDAGEVGYFPEGVHYGPQEGGPNRVVLLLQVGGASGLGYLSVDQLRTGREQLLAEGVFEKGVFRRQGGDGKKNEDGYEAIWRHVTGGELAYPKPRYKTPVVMRPEGFAWHDVAGEPGVRQRFLGAFAERGLSLDFVAIEAGSMHVCGESDARRLVFVCDGEGQCNAQAFFPQSAIRLEPGDTAKFAASTATRLFQITVPLVGKARPAAAAKE